MTQRRDPATYNWLSWPHDVRLDALAKCARNLPCTTDVAFAPETSPAALSREDLAASTIAACEVLAALHAHGFGGRR